MANVVTDGAIRSGGKTPLTQPWLSVEEAVAMGRWLWPGPETGGPDLRGFYDFVYRVWRQRRGAVDCSMFRVQANAVCQTAYPGWPADQVNTFVGWNLNVASAILTFLDAVSRLDCQDVLDPILPVEYFCYGLTVANSGANRSMETMLSTLAQVAAGDVTLFWSDAESRLAIGPMTDQQAQSNAIAALRQRRNERAMAARMLTALSRGMDPSCSTAG